MRAAAENWALPRKTFWAWFENNGGITDDNVREVLGEMADRSDPAKNDADQPISQRLSLMAPAWRRDLMSEGQLAELLKVGRVELRGIRPDRLEERDTDELLKLPIDIPGALILTRVFWSTFTLPKMASASSRPSPTMSSCPRSWPGS